jgi:hypothetical protein
MLVSHLQVDLFFYRDPEEAKQLEEEEALVAPDYGAVAEYTAPGADNWGGEWGAGEAAAPAASIPAAGADWAAAPGPVTLLIITWIFLLVFCLHVLSLSRIQCLID